MDFENAYSAIIDFVNECQENEVCYVCFKFNDSKKMLWDSENLELKLKTLGESYNEFIHQVDTYMHNSWLRINKIEITFCDLMGKPTKKTFKISHIVANTV